MAKYKITVKKSVAKELEGIPKKDLQKVVKCIQSLGQEPRPQNVQKLSHKQQYRVRRGDYRIIYFIDDKDLIIDIVKIDHRRDIYRL